MINKLVVAGLALIAIGNVQALTLEVTYNDKKARCVLNEHNYGRAEFEDGNVALNITAVPQEDGSVIATISVENEGKEQATSTIVVPATEPAVLASTSPEATNILSIAVDNTQPVTNEIA